MPCGMFGELKLTMIDLDPVVPSPAPSQEKLLVQHLKELEKYF